MPHRHKDGENGIKNSLPTLTFHLQLAALALLKFSLHFLFTNMYYLKKTKQKL